MFHKFFIWLSFFVLVSHISSAQNPWKEIKESTFSNRLKSYQKLKPSKSLIFRVEKWAAFRQNLNLSPIRDIKAKRQQGQIIQLPDPEGNMLSFELLKEQSLPEELQRKYPNIQSFVGVSTSNPLIKLRMEYGPSGYNAKIYANDGKSYVIEPYSKLSTIDYQVYYTANAKVDRSKFICYTDEEDLGSKQMLSTNSPISANKVINEACGTLRTYRIAIAASSSYTSYHSLTTDSTDIKKAKALAAINTAINRLNQVYETELSVHLQLIPTNDLIIYTKTSSDPYAGVSLDNCLSLNHTNLNTVIGTANYDWGHLFSASFDGGKASRPSVCSASYKGSGATGLADPVGDSFVVELVAHELGHQMGANHTQYNSCNRNQATSIEPGSGTTIMSYAGVCPPNVQNYSEGYFHGISLDEMISTMHFGEGNTCAVRTSTGNSAPIITSELPDYHIPKSTPFVLNANASDPNNDNLTYTWEQMDVLPVGGVAQTMSPVSTNINGPLFRSYYPSSNPSRWFPALSNVLANTAAKWEVLPSVNRELNFRATVRDNYSGGGCRTEDNVVVKVHDTAGPFLVSYPNTALNWKTTYKQKIKWDVANTNKAPINCKNVAILYSSNGGNTFETIAQSVPNTGIASITVPNSINTQSRFKIQAIGNIFYDMSNVNLSITAANSPDYQLWVEEESKTICGQSTLVYQVDIRSILNYTTNVNLSVSGLPVGVSANFQNSLVSPGNSTNLTLSNLSSLSTGTYTLTVNATNASNSQSMEVAFTVLPNSLPVQALSPVHLAAGVSWIAPKLSWKEIPTADYYDLQVSTDASFNTLLINESNLVDTTFSFTSNLSASTTYFWRVRAKNSCMTGDYSTFKFITSIALQTFTFSSFDVPKTISTTAAGTFNSTLKIEATGKIYDVDLINLDISHTYIQDIKVQLYHPDNTFITLFNFSACGNKDNVKMGFDDESTNATNTIPCPPTVLTTNYVPTQALSTFDNKSVTGTWTLSVVDNYAGDGGKINGWALRITLLPTYTWNGSINSAWSQASNWTPAGVPPTGADVEIPDSLANYPVLDQDVTIGNFKIQDLANLNLNGKSLSVLGTISGLGNLKGNPLSSLYIKGNSGNLHFDQTIEGTTNALHDLHLEEKSTTQLDTKLQIVSGTNPGFIVLNNQATLNTLNHLVLQSDSLGTASIQSSVGTILGNVEVQRFIPAKGTRKWVFLSTPVIQPANQFIKDGWQQQIFISGAGTGGSPCGQTNGNGLVSSDKFNSNGFDVTTLSTSSLFKYNTTLINNSHWEPMANTNALSLQPGTGYRLNIRGTRGISDNHCLEQLNSISPPAPTSVVLKSIGTVTVGSFTTTLTNDSNHPYSFIGNPYASPIDFASFYLTNASKIYDKFWTYSPTKNANIYTYYNAGSYTNQASGWDINSGNLISSGQAFFVEGKANQTTVEFLESMKTNASIPSTNYFRNTYKWENLIRVKLITNTKTEVDETLLRFTNDPLNSTKINTFDSYSFNSGTAIAFVKDNQKLAIQTRSSDFTEDEIALSLTTLNLGNYQLAFSELGTLLKTHNVYLLDHYVSQKIKLNATSVYTFTTNADTLSVGSNRFKLVIKKHNPNFQILGINGLKNSNKNKIEWKVNTEDHLIAYSIERSVDGVHFSEIGKIFADDHTLYSFEDNLLTANSYWYRVKTTGDSAYVTQSSITIHLNEQNETSVNVYPNPAESVLSLFQTGNKDRAYDLTIFDLAGKNLLHQTGLYFGFEPYQLDIRMLPKGSYILQLVDSYGKITTIRFLKN